MHVCARESQSIRYRNIVHSLYVLKNLDEYTQTLSKNLLNWMVWAEPMENCRESVQLTLIDTAPGRELVGVAFSGRT